MASPGDFGNGQSAGKYVSCHMESATFGRREWTENEIAEKWAAGTGRGLERSGIRIRDLIVGISSDLFFLLPPWPPTSLSSSCL